MNKIWTGWAIPDWRRLSGLDRLAWAIGTGFGSGFSPLAPGTAGAAAAAGIYCILMALFPGESSFWTLIRLLVLAVMIVSGIAVGVWATGRMSTDADPDPGSAVWDEFVGMWITLIPTAWAAWDLILRLATPWWPLWWVALCFLAFRAFDTLKPWPCRRLEDLHGGWGIMLDDVAAGVWALVVSTVVYAAVQGALFYFYWPA